ncbi:MAG: hypothetical protein PHY92_05380 [Alphaproteobacteria bacterium]|nr:hypothetical protein [Alphaproteobacteria bacterium]
MNHKMEYNPGHVEANLKFLYQEMEEIGCAMCGVSRKNVLAVSPKAASVCALIAMVQNELTGHDLLRAPWNEHVEGFKTASFALVTDLKKNGKYAHAPETRVAAAEAYVNLVRAQFHRCDMPLMP